MEYGCFTFFFRFLYFSRLDLELNGETLENTNFYCQRLFILVLVGGIYVLETKKLVRHFQSVSSVRLCLSSRFGFLSTIDIHYDAISTYQITSSSSSFPVAVKLMQHRIVVSSRQI